MKRKVFSLLMFVLAIVAQAQQISYVEETKNWYYVYDDARVVLAKVKWIDYSHWFTQ